MSFAKTLICLIASVLSLNLGDCAKGYGGPLTTEMHEFVAANPKHHNYHFTDMPFQKARYDAGAVDSDENGLKLRAYSCRRLLVHCFP